MRKPKIYLETSVISHLKQDNAPKETKVTLALWEELKKGLYDIYISSVVLNEVKANKEPKRTLLLEHLKEIEYKLMAIDDETEAYAKKMIEEGILTVNHYEDCLHIACAVVNDCDMILSWNIKHIVRVKTVNGVRLINAMFGYHGIDIYLPSMIINKELN